MINLLLPLNLQYFAEGDADTTQDTSTDTQQDAQSSAETKVESTDTPVENAKTFTQAELDEILAKRIERERKKFADYDEIKTKASEYEAELEAKRLAELSDVEKAQELASKYEAELKELKTALENERKQAQQQAIKNEFIKVASSANIIDIDAAIALSDLSAVSIDESGAVVGVDDVIKTLVEHKPYLVAKKQTQSIGQATNVSGGQYADKTADQLLEDAAIKAKQSGTLADKVAYAKLKKELGK